MKTYHPSLRSSIWRVTKNVCGRKKLRCNVYDSIHQLWQHWHNKNYKFVCLLVVFVYIKYCICVCIACRLPMPNQWLEKNEYSSLSPPHHYSTVQISTHEYDTTTQWHIDIWKIIRSFWVITLIHTLYCWLAELSWVLADFTAAEQKNERLHRSSSSSPIHHHTNQLFPFGLDGCKFIVAPLQFIVNYNIQATDCFIN